MKFEELYKKSRDTDHISLDESAIWEGIEQRLEKPKRKRRFFWIWGLGLMSAIIAGILIFGLHSSPSNPHTLKNSQVKNTDPLVTNSNTPTSKDVQSTIQNALMNSDLRETSELNKSEIKTSSSKNLTSQKGFTKNTFKQSSPIQKKNINSSQKGSVSFIDEPFQNTFNQNSGNQETQIEEVSNPKVISSILAQTDRNYEILSIQEIPFLEFILNPNPRNTAEIHQIPYVLPSDKTDKKLELAIALGFLNHSYTLKDLSNSASSWAGLHQSSKSANLGFEFDALLRYPIRSGIFVGVGVRLRVLSEWYDAVVITENPITLPSDSATYYQVNGIKQYTPGTISATEFQSTKYHTPVRRVYIDLPLELGYRKKWNKWQFNTTFSYNLNLLHRYFGRSFNRESILLSAQELSDNNVYYSTFVHSANLRFGAAYELSKFSSIGIQLNYWQQFSSSIALEQQLEERYSGYGTNLQYLISF